ncbi:uncharacterized protein F4822DRAFT_343803 [Hypoxylon trugodes]|uniref:uncharacterized protein n=1 Tax=Hypoxylon trugodes TaxID=326681 RepID=UPI00219C73BE|nr:uncharacterized protein F4822DRAFT_343803 [Hypoxylon trugodes]KAI1385414.1 hypothetical protein F4822DRAFT_343803 [Hypoxylon trugodes]
MLLNAVEVAKHNTTSSCWIVINRKVYDVTSYLDQHPGGAAILIKQSGKDATPQFRTVHSPDVLENLPKGSYLGEMDPAALATLTSESATAAPPIPTPTSSPSSSPPSPIPTKQSAPHIAHCVRVSDFETAAKGIFSANVFSYVSSNANSGLSMQGNLSSWESITFRPRVLRGVEHVSPRSRIFGHDTPFPFFVCPMGQLGRCHPDGEDELVRGLARRGIHGLISTESSRPMEGIMSALRDEQEKLSSSGVIGSQLHFQLYVYADQAVTRKRIRRAKEAGYKSLWVTVDTPILGKRTSDRRIQVSEALEIGLEQAAEQAGFGRRSHVTPSVFRPGLSWADLEWIKEEWDGPVVLKGVQCAEDARLAVKYGCQGILLSNHGGRQAHTAPDALSTLLEIREYAPEVLGQLDIFVDGGLRDGADVLKAICLGATAVGVGRPFFYALGVYGSKGVERCIDILSEELASGMSLLGITSLEEARPERVNATRLLNAMWRPEKSRL